VADVYLQKEVNELDPRHRATKWVLVQPGKRATGDWCQYTAADEVAVLKGNPAHGRRC
jgi:hypothetical protein